jgi:hypothetical protein
LDRRRAARLVPRLEGRANLALKPWRGLEGALDQEAEFAQVAPPALNPRPAGFTRVRVRMEGERRLSIRYGMKLRFSQASCHGKSPAQRR